MTYQYIDTNGAIQDCDTSGQSSRKCYPDTCSNTKSTFNACSGNTLNAWFSGGSWGYYGRIGDDLIFLYSEVEAPDEYLCNYPRVCGSNYYYSWSYNNFYNYWWYYGYNDYYQNYSNACTSNTWSTGYWWGWSGEQRPKCDDERGDCTFPRLVNCKTRRCVNGTYSSYDNCQAINGEDRKRCCALPTGWNCAENENYDGSAGCDYSYAIVKKTYTVEYELVKDPYVCVEEYPEYPETSCESFYSYYSWYYYYNNGNYFYNNFPVSSYPDKCYTCVTNCDPPQRCVGQSSDGSCVGSCCPGTEPKEHYTKIDTQIFRKSWRFEKEDCACTCQPCLKCSEYDDCTFANYTSLGNSFYYGYDYYSNGLNWGTFSNIGSDCCNQNNFNDYYYGYYYGYYYYAPPLCPNDDFTPPSVKWYCYNGTCQSGSSVPVGAKEFSSKYACLVGGCEHGDGDENRCYEPPNSYTTGLCCDKDFMKNNTDRADQTNSCWTAGPSYTEDIKTNIGTSECRTDISYQAEKCTFKPKYCTMKKVEEVRTTDTYEYEIEMPETVTPGWEACTRSYSGGYYYGGVNAPNYTNLCDPESLQTCINNYNNSTIAPDFDTGKTIVKYSLKYNPEEIVGSTTVKLNVYYCKITTKPCTES